MTDASLALSRLIYAEPGVPPVRADREHTLALPDGRRLGAAEFGPRERVPIVYLHGFLGSRLEPSVGGPLTVNTIGVDRPGYGRSDLQPAPSLAAFGRDVRAGLDALGIERCVVVGASTGAPYALAAAVALGRRAIRLVLLAGVGGPDVLRRAGGGAEVIVRLAGRELGRGGLLRRWFRFARRSGLDRTLLGLGIASEAGPLARHGLSPAAVHERMLQSLRCGSEPSLPGPEADARLLTRPWDLDPAPLTADTLVRHGGDDPVVPVDHARWYADRLPGARLELVPGEHHLSLCFASVPLVERLAREAAET